MALAPHDAKIQLAHERGVEHQSTQQRHQQQHTHRAKKQFPRDARKQINVQAIHHAHEPGTEGRFADNCTANSVHFQQHGIPFIGNRPAI